VAVFTMITDTFANIFQMTIYVFFPVALFYYFNRPEFQRKALEEKKVLVNLTVGVCTCSLLSLLL
jgi:amino acid transporter